MTHLSERKKITIMIAIMVAMFFSAINQTIIGVAMPRIIAKLGGMDYYTWAITIYLLTTAVATILVGKLSDIYGRKPFILLGIGLFTIGAFLSGLSADIFQLIAFRGITGFGAGIIMATAFSAVGDLYMPRERAKWTGLMSGVFGISSVLGPLMGGYIVDNLSWHWVFWVFLPLGVIAFILIAILFPKVPRKEGESIDYLGSFFITVTIVALLLAFSLAGDVYAWGSIQIIGLFGITLVSLVIFIFVESKAKSPVLPLSLFKNDIVTVSNAAGFLLGAGMMGVMIYTPFFIQGVLGINPTGSGLIMMPMSIVMVFGTITVGQLMTSRGTYKKLAIFGLATTTIGITLLSLISIGTPIFVLIMYLSVIGLGLGISMPIFSLTVQNAVPLQQLGVATASSQLFRSLGNTIGVGILGSVMAGRMKSRMTEMFANGEGIPSGEGEIPPEQAEQVEALMNPEILLDQPRLADIQASMPAEMVPFAERMVETLRDVFSDALTTTFLVAAIIMVVSVIVVFFLREIPLVSEKDYGPPKKDGEDSPEETSNIPSEKEEALSGAEPQYVKQE